MIKDNVCFNKRLCLFYDYKLCYKTKLTKKVFTCPNFTILRTSKTKNKKIFRFHNFVQREFYVFF